MESRNVELNTFAASTTESNDDNMYSTDHPLYPDDEVACEQNLKGASNNPNDFSPFTENDEQKLSMDRADVGLILEILYNFYAELFIIVAGLSLVIELIPGPIQLFHSHVYIFILLLCVGIVILLYGVKRNLLWWNTNKETITSQSCHNCLSNGMKNSRTRKFASLCLKSTVFVLGFSVLISISLESAVTFTSSKTCVNLLSSSLPVLQCIFIFLQMIFVITCSKDTYNVFGCVHKFLTMHLIATNIALCVRVFIWGTALDWEKALHINHLSSKRWERNDLNITMHALEVKKPGHLPDHVVHVTSNCWWRNSDSSGLEDITAVDLCLQDATLGLLWSKASQFFYPFIMQYYILVVCFLFYVTCNCKLITMEQSSSQSMSLCDNRRIPGLYRRSTKGLSLGFLVFTSVIIYVIMYFVMENLKFNVILMSEYCFIFGLSTFAGILCFFQVKKLSLKDDRDDLQTKKIQKVGAVAVNLLGVCNIVSGCLAIRNFSFLLLLEGIFLVLQTLTQYVLVVQLSKRRVDPSNVLEKPGRQCVAFLMLCNISLWVLDCVVSWNNIQHHLQAAVLGQIAWHILARLLFPVIAFYRLHSTVVFFEAWKNCYF